MAPVRLWKKSLYARAFLFTAIGSGALLGAVAVQSWILVNGTVDRLLDERIGLARSTGSYLEEVIHHDLDQMADLVLPSLRDGAGSGTYDQEEMRRTLSNSFSATIFQEGAFVLDKNGRVLVGVPEADPSLYRNVPKLAELAVAARAIHGPVASELIYLPPGLRPVLVFVCAVRGNSGSNVKGPAYGFVGGLLHPASNNLLRPFVQNANDSSHRTLQLLDASGYVVAATHERSLFIPSDHGSLLSNAIVQKRELRGRCHSCHLEQVEQGPKPQREMEVLAFSPLPTMKLGVAVRQLESEALAPAFSLQHRLLLIGVAFILLFLLFTGLAVYSVAAPLRRLTLAVRDLEGDPKRVLPSFGTDEVGELASTVDRWRTRVFQSVEALRKQETKLENEVDLSKRHLAALQLIGESGSQNVSVSHVLNQGLDALTGFTGFSKGVIRFRHQERVFTVQRELSDPQISEILDSRSLRPIGPGPLRIVRFSSPEWPPSCASSELKSLLIAELVLGDNLGIKCALADTRDIDASAEDRRIQSFLHQVVISAGSRLFHEEELLRHQQSREFLQKLLSAQEEERRRIARELHDTLAQDLAAHRLEIERLGSEASKGEPSVAFEKRIGGLESKAQQMLVSLRHLLLDLRPSVLDTMGFLPALQWYLERTQRDHGIRGTLTVDGDEVKLDQRLEINLFRIFQEGLQNVIQHSRADHVLVSVTYLPDAFEMTIEDDGNGFAEAEVKMKAAMQDRQGRGLGILGMRERSSLLGGEFKLISEPERGTTLYVKVPLNGNLANGASG